jgi:hypothetical protein
VGGGGEREREREGEFQDQRGKKEKTIKTHVKVFDTEHILRFSKLGHQ